MKLMVKSKVRYQRQIKKNNSYFLNPQMYIQKNEFVTLYVRCLCTLGLAMPSWPGSHGRIH